MTRPTPRKAAPELSVPTLDGANWTPASVHASRFSMLVFYRGVHCPMCKTYLGELDRTLSEFDDRGLETIAISADTEERARQAHDSWTLTRLRLGYSLPIATARAWGLYISNGRDRTSAGVEEPAQFCEPGVFLLRPDQTVYWAAIQSMPFGRPHFRDILSAIDFVISNDYPARGEA